ncbi:MAG: hypothetical protein M1818_004961 [Claussenomyces sp. TS43310]|nr:MAG: hypothetical protein M1818_004961 [Claussenomyces sp. TS43310]
MDSDKATKAKNLSSDSDLASVSDVADEINIASLEGLQTDEQRGVLDIVAQLRKCGLEGVLSLPQLVVCGDQSAGKSSVLEALTEIPFPRNDNLCTRYPTEIILRRASTNSLTIRVIPDADRPSAEQEAIKDFSASITDFDQLPDIMARALLVMGISGASNVTSEARAFAKDVLSIEIEGPSRPQLTLVDLPGLIQNETKGVTKADVEMVAEITDRYISQPRTICLAVIAATNDYANQSILTKVRKVDPKGLRTLGIITKPDRLPSNSGMEQAFLALARNEDVVFNLGWHVLKNRSFDENGSTFLERKASESAYFRKSNFKTLSQDCVGIESLRIRLSQLLFEHVKQELPKLREDSHTAMRDAKCQLEALGDRRSTPQDCKAYLSQLSLNYYEVCKAAVKGHYEGTYFTDDVDVMFALQSPATIRRLRAVIQKMNSEFSDNLRQKGHKYQIGRAGPGGNEAQEPVNMALLPKLVQDIVPQAMPDSTSPIHLSDQQALRWAGQVLIRTRGQELPGNFNPLLVGELFWEQSSNWYRMAEDHVESVADVCRRFLDILLREKCPNDIRSRLWSSRIQDPLKDRSDAAVQELTLLSTELKSYPINYNHYYTDTIKKRRLARESAALAQSIEAATQHKRLAGCNSDHTSATIDVDLAIKTYSETIDPDMEKHSCEEALDCLSAIYKVSQKTFVANVTTQVIERHIVKGLELIFSPIVVNAMSDAEVEEVAVEPASAKRQRDFLEDRVARLDMGSKVLREVIRSSS